MQGRCILGGMRRSPLLRWSGKAGNSSQISALEHTAATGSALPPYLPVEPCLEVQTVQSGPRTSGTCRLIDSSFSAVWTVTLSSAVIIDAMRPSHLREDTNARKRISEFLPIGLHSLSQSLYHCLSSPACQLAGCHVTCHVPQICLHAILKKGVAIRHIYVYCMIAKNYVEDGSLTCYNM
ncbi:hypothetical protein BJV74DRAFT_241658 [Russula compacta]|nr:hypothetical protein BJV74DRAFT_241658 [Russula compacta]